MRWTGVDWDVHPTVLRINFVIRLITSAVHCVLPASPVLVLPFDIRNIEFSGMGMRRSYTKVSPDVLGNIVRTPMSAGVLACFWRGL